MSAPRNILYTHDIFIRTIVPECLISYFNLDFEVVEIDEAKEQYAIDFPIKTTPALKLKDGSKFFEQLAVNEYLVRSTGNEAEIKQLLGSCDDLLNQANINSVASFGGSDVLNILAGYVKPYIGMLPYDEAREHRALEKLNIFYQFFEEKLATNKYLTGDEITMADLITATSLKLGFAFMFGREWRDEHKSLTEWFENVIHSKYLESHFKDFKYPDVPPTL
ncbi:similar to Saccharomyces cerevisiae YGR201C Putative protein of unknown function [Maudiozyma saulgeensis]|uniref:GST C-terminal domain-containing protein n=1 Tax=Maudiozyma saulgeensis TaxID=1789683 RepID=A0A1X7R040_9SACH|nr:similar to Saccharomyces cerevisiae YGR201C Putative protein of unknown function [Kazachstania saulgeensis]